MPLLANKPHSTLGQACLLWLLTNALGTAACYSYMWLEQQRNHSTDNIFFYQLFISALAGLGSLLAIPLAVPAFRKVLAQPLLGQRLLGAALAVSTIFLAVGFLLFLFTFGLLLIALMMGAWTYAPAALLAALAVYRRGLLHPDITGGALPAASK